MLISSFYLIMSHLTHLFPSIFHANFLNFSYHFFWYEPSIAMSTQQYFLPSFFMIIMNSSSVSILFSQISYYRNLARNILARLCRTWNMSSIPSLQRVLTHHSISTMSSNQPHGSNLGLPPLPPSVFIWLYTFFSWLPRWYNS